MSIFDKNVYSRFTDNDWEGGDIKQGENNLYISDSKNLPERPLFICNAHCYDFSLHLKENSQEYKMIEDSLKSYDAIYQKNVAPMMTNQQIDMKKFAALSETQKGKIEAVSKVIFEKKQSLLNGKTIRVKTDINDPFFYISSPKSGFVAARYKKINVPGCPVAYAISLEPGTVSSSYRILLGFGKWPQKIINNNEEIYTSYQFAHHFPDAVIENFVIQIDVPDINEGMKLIGKIDCDKLNEALTM